MKGQLHMSPLKGVMVGEAANGPGVPRGCRGGEERALPLSFQFSQMKTSGALFHDNVNALNTTSKGFRR